MIQRIQSVFLLLASASFWALFEFPFASSDVTTTGFLADSKYMIEDHVILLVMAMLGGVLALSSIFIFKNRRIQIKLTYITLILGILLPLVAAFLFYNEASKIYQKAIIEDNFGIYLPVMAIIFSILAIRFIKKDQKIVNSMDRLR